MKVGMVFASTGGFKILRSVRSLRRMETDLPIFVVLDVSSATYKNGGFEIVQELKTQKNVYIRSFENKYHINGTLNEAMRWMKELGFHYGCLFHDDLIFSPFVEHTRDLTHWFSIIDTLPKFSGLTLSLMETGITGPDGDLFTGNMPPSWWDGEDLESESVWSRLLPGCGIPGGFKEDGKTVYEVSGAFRVKGSPIAIRYYYGDVKNYTRLGPTGQIVPVRIWEEIGKFDETEGIHYDAYYPAECAARGFPPIAVIPNVPHLHLHNQSIGYQDPSTGLWGNVSEAFERKYGKDFWNRQCVKS